MAYFEVNLQFAHTSTPDKIQRDRFPAIEATSPIRAIEEAKEEISEAYWYVGKPFRWMVSHAARLPVRDDQWVFNDRLYRDGEWVSDGFIALRRESAYIVPGSVERQVDIKSIVNSPSKPIEYTGTETASNGFDYAMFGGVTMWAKHYRAGIRVGVESWGLMELETGRAFAGYNASGEIVTVTMEVLP